MGLWYERLFVPGERKEVIYNFSGRLSSFYELKIDVWSFWKIFIWKTIGVSDAHFENILYCIIKNYLKYALVKIHWTFFIFVICAKIFLELNFQSIFPFKRLHLSLKIRRQFRLGNALSDRLRSPRNTRSLDEAIAIVGRQRHKDCKYGLGRRTCRAEHERGPRKIAAAGSRF